MSSGLNFIQWLKADIFPVVNQPQLVFILQVKYKVGTGVHLKVVTPPNNTLTAYFIIKKWLDIAGSEVIAGHRDVCKHLQPPVMLKQAELSLHTQARSQGKKGHEISLTVDVAAVIAKVEAVH